MKAQELRVGTVIRRINSKKDNEIIKIEDGMVTMLQYDIYTEDKEVRMYLKEILSDLKRGMVYIVLEREIGWKLPY